MMRVLGVSLGTLASWQTSFANSLCVHTKLYFNPFKPYYSFENALLLVRESSFYLCVSKEK